MAFRLQLVDHILVNDLVVQAEALRDVLLNPGLHHVEVHLLDVHLLGERLRELELLQQLLVLVREAIVLVGAGAAEEAGVGHGGRRS